MKYEKAIERRLRLIESAMAELRKLNDLRYAGDLSGPDLRTLDTAWDELFAAKYALKSVTGKDRWPQHLSVLSMRRLAKEVASRSCAEPGKTVAGPEG